MKKILLLTVYQLLLAGLAFGQTGWTWLNPRPSGFDCEKMVFVDRNTGYLLNSNGDLFRTFDQGVSWDMMRNFPGAAVMEIRDSTGVIGTSTGIIYLSADDGNSWGRIAVDTPDAFRFVNIISRDSLIVATGSGNIYVTGDRGQTWEARHGINGINCINWLNSRIGYAGSGVALVMTTDGGQTWATINEVLNSSGTVSAIGIVNADTIVAFRSNDSVMVTHDGWKSWQDYVYIGISPPTVVEFVSPAIGYMAGPTGVLCRTTNGGTGWAPVAPWSPPGEGHSLYSLSFVSVDTGFAVGEFGQIWKTTDTGATWISYSATYSDMTDAGFATPSTGYAATQNVLLKTIDSGRTWSTLSLNPNFNPSVSGNTFRFVHFSSADTGFAVTQELVYVYRTTDGGQTWSATSLPAQVAFGSQGISYTGPQSSLLCLSTFIAQSNDDWTSWSQLWPASPQYIGPPNGLNLIFPVNATTAYGCYGGQLYKTTNGYQSWTSVYGTMNNYYITGIWFLDAQNGFISDEESDVMETNDGGNTWRQVHQHNPAIDGNFSSVVKFFNNQIGYLANRDGSYYGTIYKTVDGGQTWEVSYPVAGGAISFTPDSNVVIAGYGGAILRAPIRGWQTDSVAVRFNNACGTLLSADAGVALGELDSLQFVITSAGGTVSTIGATPGYVVNGRVWASATVNGLQPATVYTARLRFFFIGQVGYSDTVEFTAIGLPVPAINDSLGTLISSAQVGNQWYLNGNTITGAVGQRYVPDKTGVYTVQVTENGCSSLSAPADFRTDQLGITLYPDPARNFLYIRNTQNRALGLRIIDLTGRVVITMHYSGFPIDVSGLAPGEYILSLTDLSIGQRVDLLFLKL